MFRRRDLGDVHDAIRRAALDYHIPYTTTVSGAAALVKGIRELRKNQPGVQPVQYFT